MHRDPMVQPDKPGTSRSAWRWLRFLSPMPWLALLSGAKDFSDNVVLGSARLNAWGLHVWRKKLADRVCASRRARMREALPRALTAQWDQDGYVRIDDFLDKLAWDAVRDELLHAALPMVEMAQPPALTRRANLDAQTCKSRYPALYQLITDRTLLGLLRYAAGYPGMPVVAVQCIHSDLGDPPSGQDPQSHWHADTFHSTAKAWLFLHAVGAGDGPLGYVPGSHRCSARRLAWEREQSMGAATHPDRLHAKGSFRADDASLKAMGYGTSVRAHTRGNTLVVADTSGFHRREPSVHATVRVEIYFSLRRNPFFAGLYPSLLGLPWLRERWAGWLFEAYQWLQRRGTPSWIAQEAAGLDAGEKRALREPGG
jgi:hypothetical protein